MSAPAEERGAAAPRKWRPPLGLVVLAILATVAALPFAGLFLAGLFGPQPIDRAGAGVAAPGLAVAAAVAGATLLIGLVFVRTILRPVRELMARTHRIAAGDAAAMRPLAYHGTREMAELASAFLDMARKLKARTDAVQTFARHLSHELKSPLTGIKGAAELLRDGGRDMSEAQREKFLDNILGDVDRLDRLVGRLLELARAEHAGPTGEAASLDAALATLPPERRLVVLVEEGGAVRLPLSAENADIVLKNLIDNAAQHGAATLRLAARRSDRGIVVTASDDGHGISPANRGRVFEPFFTTRRDEGGTGLGLGIVAALVAAHGGTIRLAEAQAGASFEIVFPAA